MKNALLILTLLYITALPVIAENGGLITASKITLKDGREEFAIIIRPKENEAGKAFPILYAPGDQDYPDPIFFWGDTPTSLGWIIVQTEAFYKGTPKQLLVLMEAVEAKLKQEGYQTAERHIISWSANSGAGARHAGALGTSLRSASFIPGYGAGQSVEQICRHKNMRINFITGSRDKSWLRGAEKMRDQLETCGMEYVTFVTIEGGGHVLKEIAGEPLFKVLNSARKHE